MWLAAVILMFLNSFVDRYDGYHLGIPAILLALGASSWTMAALNAYSRRVMLEVISWEHQQLRAEQQPGRSLAAVD